MSSPTQPAPSIRAGVYTTVERAESAVRALIDAGFDKDQITVLCSDEKRQEHFGSVGEHGEVTETDQEATLSSGLVGGLLGGLISLAAVATTGGLGIVAVGPVLGGTITGSLIGYFVGHGVEDELARFYEQAVAKGNLLVAVKVDDPETQAGQLRKAAEILQDSGAEPFALDKG